MPSLKWRFRSKTAFWSQGMYEYFFPTENWHVTTYLYQEKVCESQKTQQWGRDISVPKENGTETDYVHAWNNNLFYWIDISHLDYLVSFWGKGRLKLSYTGSIIMTLHVCHAVLTPKHRETHGCVVSTVATDALVLKHQAISIHNAD